MDSINQERQQQINRALVIDLLRQEGICSRANLSNLSNLKRATITNIINDFIDSGLVVETGLLDGDKGRRSIGICINGQRYQVVGVMVTRRFYSVIRMGLSGEVFATASYPIQDGTQVHDIISDIKEKIQVMIQSAGDAEVLAVGIAMPGPYKRERGEMIFVTNLLGWEGVPIFTSLQEGFDIPVYIENDANAGAYAYLWYGGRKSELQNLAYIVAGQGTGCGIISGGAILRGEMGLAGEIGHTSINFEGPLCECGNRGCLETYCSSIVLEKNIRRRLEAGEDSSLSQSFTWDDVVRAVRKGDKVAKEEYEACCKYLAIGIVSMINQLNPGKVVIGDQLADIQPKTMLEIVNRHVRASSRPLIWENLKIEVNQLDYNPVLLGSAVVAAQNIFENPFKFIKSCPEP